MSQPQVIQSVEQMMKKSRHLRSEGTLALVPTMGALHEGHLSLVRAARREHDRVVVSIFVNPTQFGPNEDYALYPRSLDTDLELLAAEGVEAVFAPSADQMYPPGASATSVDVPEIGSRLDGQSRPGHFRGVATVVAKLFHIVSPDAAYFGQKDAAQVAVLRAMVRDLNFPLDLRVCPTVRESDGLARSSRNRFLSTADRKHATVLHRALEVARTAALDGRRQPDEVRELMLGMLSDQPRVRVDYAEVVDDETLLPVEDFSHGALLAVAAWIGETRLIDNVLVPTEVPCD